MKKIIITLMLLAVVFFMAGCTAYVAPPRAHVYVRPPCGRVWVPGHVTVGGVWVPGHWRCR